MPLHCTHPQIGIAEEVDHRGNGITHIEGMPFPTRGKYRKTEHIVSNGGSIHPQLDTKAYQHGKIPIFGGQCRYDNSAAQTQQSQLQKDQRSHKNPQIGLDPLPCHRIKYQKYHHKAILNSQTDQLGKDGGNGHDQPREIDLSHGSAVGHKGIGCLAEAVGEIGPQNGAAEIENEGGHPIRGKTGDIAKDQGEHDRRQQGLDNRPQGPQNGLLVLGNEIPLHKEKNQIPIGENLFQMQVKPAAFRLDDRCKALFLHGCRPLLHFKCNALPVV